jgi:uncharacterized protein (DUF3084 family)
MFKNIKSLFIIEEENPKKGESTKKAPKAPPKNSPAVVQSKEGAPGKVTKKFTDVLLKAMQANNIEGFDYLEFKQSLNSLSKMPMDEKTMYQSAFAMAQTMGADAGKLIQTAQHYIDVLKSEEKKFEQAVASQKQKQIASKQAKAKKVEEQIQSKAQRIKQLTQEIEAHQKQIEALKKDISAASSKVETTKNDFIASYNTIVGQIHADLENMKKYFS